MIDCTKFNQKPGGGAAQKGSSHDAGLVLEIAELVLVRGGVPVLSGFAGRARSGEIVLLAGPNGSGKSTLLRAIAGLGTPAAGVLTIEPALGSAPGLQAPADAAASAAPAAPQNRGKVSQDRDSWCHFVGHANALRPEQTVRASAAFFATFFATSAASSAHEPGQMQRKGSAIPLPIDAALAQLGLADLADVPVAYLSSGQTRRTALTRLLVAWRPIWLLDEPTVGLDRHHVGVLAAMITSFTRAGGLAVVASHEDLPLEPDRTWSLTGAGPVGGNTHLASVDDDLDSAQNADPYGGW